MVDAGAVDVGAVGFSCGKIIEFTGGPRLGRSTLRLALPAREG